jgi:hypothetical protein
VAERVHRLDLCTDCDGLRITEGTRFQVTDVRLDGPAGPIVTHGPATVELTPLDREPCPNSGEGAGHG